MEENQKDPVEQLYTEYGKFMTGFEHVCYWIRMSIHTIMNPQYDKELRIMTYVLLEGLTAKPQMDKFFNLFMHKFSSYTEMAQMAKKVKDAFVEELVPIRNSLSHGLVWPGQPDSKIPDIEDFEDPKEFLSNDYLNYSLFSLEHHKSSKKGFNRNKQILSIKDLKELNAGMNQLGECLFILRHFHEYKDMQSKHEEFLERIGIVVSGLKFKFNPLPNYWAEDEL